MKCEDSGIEPKHTLPDRYQNFIIRFTLIAVVSLGFQWIRQIHGTRKKTACIIIIIQIVLPDNSI